MKLFLLKLREDLLDYDMYHAHAVIAEDEHEARSKATEASQCGDEVKFYKNVWLEPDLSSCEEILLENEESGVLLSDFHAG